MKENPNPIYTDETLRDDLVFLRGAFAADSAGRALPESLDSAHLLARFAEIEARLAAETTVVPVATVAPEAAAAPETGEGSLAPEAIAAPEAAVAPAFAPATEAEPANVLRPRFGRPWMKSLAGAAACALIVGVLLRYPALFGGQSPVIQPAAAPAAAAPAAAQSSAAANAAPSAESQEVPMTESSTTGSVRQSAPAPEPVAYVHSEGERAASYAAIYDELKTLQTQNETSTPRIYFAVPAAGAVNEAAKAAPAPAPTMAMEDSAATGATGGGHSGTNVQTAGIDEADTVKTDGRYLYCYRYDSADGKAEIAIVEAAKMQRTATIKLGDVSNGVFYIAGDRLIVMESAYEDLLPLLAPQAKETLSGEPEARTGAEKADSSAKPGYIPGYRRRNACTNAHIYDISDPANPKKVDVYTQDGNYVDSRLDGRKLYIISTMYVNTRYGEGVDPCVYEIAPVAGYRSQKLAPVSPENVLLCKPLRRASYCVVTVLDLDDKAPQVRSLLGAGERVYMSTTGLYVAADDYNWDETLRRGQNETTILAFDVQNGGLAYRDKVRVTGSLESQFSLDEREGYLRVAITDTNLNTGESESNLYIYDPALKVCGQVNGLAPGERIYAVRYIGKMAYVVTFKQTDPLFVIDLSDPTAPKVVGELKVPGFSEYLHPLGDGLLVGLGYNTQVNQWGGVVTDGLKLTIFDVSNPAVPMEKETFLIGNSGSYAEAMDNHRAILADDARSLFGFAANVVSAKGERERFAGYLLFDLSGGRIRLAASIPSQEEQDGFLRYESGGDITRGVRIGESLYTLSQGKIKQYSLADYTKTAQLSL